MEDMCTTAAIIDCSVRLLTMLEDRRSPPHNRFCSCDCSWSLKEQSHEIVRLPNRTICEKSCGYKTSLQFYLRFVGVVFVYLGLGLVVINRAMHGVNWFRCYQTRCDNKHRILSRWFQLDY